MFRNTFQNVSRTDHPVRANFGGLRHHLLDGAATPPLQGGELAMPNDCAKPFLVSLKQKTDESKFLRCGAGSFGALFRSLLRSFCGGLLLFEPSSDEGVVQPVISLVTGMLE